MAIGEELLNVPMGDMIRQMAFAVADAQLELDESSIRVAEMMGGRQVARDENGEIVLEDDKSPRLVDTRVYFGYDVDDKGKRIPAKASMLELGFTPTFYQFIDTIIEVKIAIKITRESSSQVDSHTTSSSSRLRRSGLGFPKLQVSTTTVDASYTSKYSYSAEGSSLLRTKLVPVPPPPILEERVRLLIEREQKLNQDNG